MKPNIKIAGDKSESRVEIYFDAASKEYGIRKTETLSKDGCIFLEATKNLEMTLEQLEKLLDDAKDFLGIHKKYQN